MPKTLAMRVLATILLFSGMHMPLLGQSRAETIPLLKSENFENGWISPAHRQWASGSSGTNAVVGVTKWLMKGKYQPDCGSLSTDFARDGKYSLKVDLRYDDVKGIADQSSHRCEYMWFESPCTHYYGKSVWIAFSVYFRSDWQPQKKGSYMIFQFMQDACSADADQLVGPPGGIFVRSDGYFEMHARGDNKLQQLPGKLDNFNTKVFGPAVRGAWHDFIIHVNPITHYQAARVEAWFRTKSNAFIKVFDHSNIGTFYRNSPRCNDFIYLKFGIYTWAWTKTYYPTGEPSPNRITHYFDSIKLGGDSHTFEDMKSGLAGGIATPGGLVVR